MRKLSLAVTLTVVLAGVAGGRAQAHQLKHSIPVAKMPLKEQVAWYEANIRHAKYAIAFWKSQAQQWRFDSLHPAGALIGRADRHFHERLLRNATRNYKDVSAKYQATLLPPHYYDWLCIHNYEGSWTDPNDPYWGGLQMDRGFMTTYGSDMIAKFHGWANVWHPLDQMRVAERAYSSGRGFWPWPNTARYCGLL